MVISIICIVFVKSENFPKFPSRNYNFGFYLNGTKTPLLVDKIKSYKTIYIGLDLIESSCTAHLRCRTSDH